MWVIDNFISTTPLKTLWDDMASLRSQQKIWFVLEIISTQLWLIHGEVFDVEFWFIHAPTMSELSIEDIVGWYGVHQGAI